MNSTKNKKDIFFYIKNMISVQSIDPEFPSSPNCST